MMSTILVKKLLVDPVNCVPLGTRITLGAKKLDRTDLINI